MFFDLFLLALFLQLPLAVLAQFEGEGRTTFTLTGVSRPTTISLTNAGLSVSYRLSSAVSMKSGLPSAYHNSSTPQYPKSTWSESEPSNKSNKSLVIALATILSVFGVCSLFAAFVVFSRWRERKAAMKRRKSWTHRLGQWDNEQKSAVAGAVDDLPAKQSKFVQPV